MQQGYRLHLVKERAAGRILKENHSEELVARLLDGKSLFLPHRTTGIRSPVNFLRHPPCFGDIIHRYLGGQHFRDICEAPNLVRNPCWHLRYIPDLHPRSRSQSVKRPSTCGVSSCFPKSPYSMKNSTWPGNRRLIRCHSLSNSVVSWRVLPGQFG